MTQPSVAEADGAAVTGAQSDGALRVSPDLIWATSAAESISFLKSLPSTTPTVGSVASCVSSIWTTTVPVNTLDRV